ncbi:MAG: type II secretion system F family protein [Clostridia bacterium]|nr:type II secretion system F family protein [Clostridia bacterium]
MENLQEARVEEKRARYLPAGEISMFCEQVALILGSGVALHDGIEALCNNYKGTAFGPSFAAIDEAVKRTGSLHEALRETKAFPPYLMRMVYIGEQTGKLDEVMASLSAYYAREEATRRSIQSAVFYPLCLIIMMAVVIVVLVWRVLPIFRQVYRSLGAEISGSASALMNLGMGLGMAVLIAVGVLILVALVIALLMRTSKRRAVAAWLGKIFPPVRRMAERIAAGRFAANLGMMLKSGYPLQEALPLIEGVMDESDARAKVRLCGEEMLAGEPFPKAVADVRLFEDLHNKMIQIGFMTGQTETVMEKLAGIYQERNEQDVSRMVAMIEPTLVIMLSVIIGAILLSVMLPMISIISSIL